ncbi:unnamed protein product [Cochlearia groenlandica]
MPLSLYVCKTLVYLRLHRVLLCGFDSVSLPHLKTLHLSQNVYASETSLESLISSCRVLEEMSIVRSVDDHVKVLTVCSQTLTDIAIGFNRGENGMWFYFHREISGLFVVAPRLKYLSFNDEVSKCDIVSKLGSSVKANILGGVFYISYFSDEIGFSEQQMARKFFTGISNVSDMLIYANLESRTIATASQLVEFRSRSLFSRRGYLARAS